MEEDKRLDVSEIKNLETRVDILEGQPETPLVCPIFKTDLDNLNDRITVLEGGTPSEIKNPMQFSELNNFEGRVEELEGGGEETVEFKVGDNLSINLKNIANYLGNTLSDELLYKEILSYISGQESAGIVINGVDGDNLECLYDFEHSTCRFGGSIIENQTSIDSQEIVWTCTAYGNSLGDSCAILEETDIENNNLVVGKDFKFYKKPHVTINFLDGTTEEVISTEDIEIFKKEEPVPPTPTRDVVTYAHGDAVTLNPTFFNTTLLTELPQEALNKEPVTTGDSGAYDPTFIFLGPDTEYTIEGTDYAITGDNVLGVTVNGEGEVRCCFSTYNNKLTDWVVSLGDISNYSKAIMGSIETLLQQTIEVSPSQEYSLTEDLNLFNPVKVIVIGCDSGAFDPTNYVEVDLTTKGQPLSASNPSC